MVSVSGKSILVATWSVVLFKNSLNAACILGAEKYGTPGMASSSNFKQPGCGRIMPSLHQLLICFIWSATVITCELQLHLRFRLVANTPQRCSPFRISNMAKTRRFSFTSWLMGCFMSSPSINIPPSSSISISCTLDQLWAVSKYLCSQSRLIRSTTNSSGWFSKKSRISDRTVW